MDKQKLNVVIMGQDCEKFIGMCLKSVKDADNIIYCDGGSTDRTLHNLKGFIPGRGEHIKDGWNVSEGNHKYVITHTYDQEDPKMNGKQRNYYLKFLKENFMGEWVLCLDADEVVEDLSKIKELISHLQPEAEDILFSVKMRHLIGNLATEDATQAKHFVPRRLFKVAENLFYPELEHPVLDNGDGMNARTVNVESTTIWHMSHITEMFNVKQKYDNHMKKSKMHPPEFLKWWYMTHLFGQYPTKIFHPVELPDPILNYFNINKDELYFSGRMSMEPHHYQDAVNWKAYLKPHTATLFGCGFGQRVKALQDVGITTRGYEINEFAVKHSLASNVYQNDVCVPLDMVYTSDLIVAYDILEHLQYNDLDKAINNLVSYTKKNLLISVPFKGSKDCAADPTHVIIESRDWWIEQFTKKGLKLIDTPAHFYYPGQILIFEKEMKA